MTSETPPSLPTTQRSFISGQPCALVCFSFRFRSGPGPLETGARGSENCVGALIQTRSFKTPPRAECLERAWSEKRITHFSAASFEITSDASGCVSRGRSVTFSDGTSNRLLP